MHKNLFYILGGQKKTSRKLVSEECAPYTARGNAALGGSRFISLFSGAMGLDLGLEAAGFAPAGCLELNKWACATIRQNRPELPVIQDDIKNWNGERLLKEFSVQQKDILFVVGGPPCPSFSTAGRRQAFNDPRGQVMMDFLRIVDEIHPPFFIMENVRGILSASLSHVPLSKRGGGEDSGLGGVMGLLNRQFKEMGYTVTAELVNAANYGTPQKRERVVFLGSSNGFQITMPAGGYGPEETMFQRKWRTLRDAFAGLDDPTPEFLPFSANRSKYLALLTEGQNWRNLPLEIQPDALGGAFNSTGGRVGFFRRLNFNEPSPTVPTSPIQKSTSLCHPTELRPLSVKEYARIQQFPDAWRFAGSASEKYRQIGNAVPVGLGYAIGAALKRFAENYQKINGEG